jgi:hypothetical protein
MEGGLYMKLLNCEECGGVMVDNPSGLCAVCLRGEEVAEDKVAEYLREISRATADEVALATGVKHKVIMRMIKRGRITSNVQISYPCETCGSPIYTGRLCGNCTKNITDQIRVESWQPKQADEPKQRDEQMYIRDMLRKK